MDTMSNNGHDPPTLRIQGQVCHRIGSLLPLSGERPKFAQLYIYDTDNEIENRIDSFRYIMLLTLYHFVFTTYVIQLLYSIFLFC